MFNDIVKSEMIRKLELFSSMKISNWKQIKVRNYIISEGRNAKDQPPPSNPLAGLPTLFSNGSPSSPSSGMPPVMVLGMHQAIIVPLSSLPGIFQNMMNGLFNTGNSQQAINLVPGIQNVMG